LGFFLALSPELENAHFYFSEVFKSKADDSDSIFPLSFEDALVLLGLNFSHSSNIFTQRSKSYINREPSPMHSLYWFNETGCVLILEKYFVVLEYFRASLKVVELL